MPSDLQELVAKLLEEVRELCDQRKWVEEQIVNKCLALSSLSRDVDATMQEAVAKRLAVARRRPGLTERVAQSFREKPHADLSAGDVRMWLEREGVDLSGYSQPLATIAITLSRMAKSGRLKIRRKGRSVTYRWIGD